MRGLCLGVARPAAPFVVSGAVSPPASASVVIDHSAFATTMWDEITGSPPATQSSVGSYVGTILNTGTAGGYVRSDSNNTRTKLGQTGSVYWLNHKDSPVGGHGRFDMSALTVVSWFIAVSWPGAMTHQNTLIGAGASSMSIAVANGNSKPFVYNGSIQYANTAVPTDGTPVVLGVDGDLSGGNHRLNGADDGSYPSAQNLGDFFGGPNFQSIEGKTYGLIGFSSAPSVSDRNQAEEWLAAKAGISI